MIVFITGETGSGKTDTGWALIAAIDGVLLDCDWFASRLPFSWRRTADVESVYRAILSQMVFHIGEGRVTLVVTLTHEMAMTFESHFPDFERFGLPVHAFRLVAQPHIIQARISERDRNQKGKEAVNAARQRSLLDKMFKDDSVFVMIDNTELDAQMTAEAIIGRAKGQVSN